MFMFDDKDIGWWYWLISVVLIVIGLCGFQAGFTIVIILKGTSKN